MTRSQPRSRRSPARATAHAAETTRSSAPRGVRTGRANHGDAPPPRHGARTVRRRPPRRNRRRGAPRSVVVRRLAAVTLAAIAVVLAVSPGTATRPDASVAAQEQTQPAGIPVVLPLADPATATVLTPGEPVDLYVAHGEQPPVLTLTGVELLDVRSVDSGFSSTVGPQSRTGYLVVLVPFGDAPVIENLLAATSIVATVSATG